MSDGWWPRLRRALRDLDQRIARDALEEFEAHHGLQLTPKRASPGDLAQVRRALTPEGRPLVEHHWATWCAPCVEEAPRIEALHQALGDRVDVVGVSWDRFSDDGAGMDATLGQVDAFHDDHGLTWPSIVVDATPDAFFDAIDPPARTVPCTRVLDVDGAVLTSFDGPLDDADVERLVALLSEVA